MTWYDGAPSPDPTAPGPAPVPDRPRAGAVARTGTGAIAGTDEGAYAPGVLDDEGLTVAQARAERTARRSRLREAAAPHPPEHGPGAAPTTSDEDPTSGSDEPVAVDHALAATSVGGRGRPPWRDRLSGVRWRVPLPTALAAVLALGLVGGAVALRVGPSASGPVVTVSEPLVTPAGGASGGDTGEASSGGTDGTTQDGADPGEPTVWVHVVGQVLAPGVVELPAGARVGDAVAAAGGALPGADVAALNLAAVVPDGAQVRVPAPGEDPPPDAALVTTGGDGSAGGAVGADGTVDVNRAGAAELETLSGIGPVLAERIVAWRTEHGPFATVESLRDVPGIGPALMSRLSDTVRV